MLFQDALQDLVGGLTGTSRQTLQFKQQGVGGLYGGSRLRAQAFARRRLSSKQVLLPGLVPRFNGKIKNGAV